MPVGQRSRWRMAPPSKWAPPARRPGSRVSNQRPCGTPGAAGVKTGKCSDSFSILPSIRNMRPAKEKKGTANRKVSGSGTGQTLKGKPQGRRWDGTSPATMAARRDEGVRFFGQAIFGWGIFGCRPTPANPGCAGYLVMKRESATKRVWMTKREAGWEPQRGRCTMANTSKGKKTPGRHGDSGHQP